MIATVFIILLIAAYAAFVIYRMIKEQKKSKADGIPKGCFSCAAYKEGNCPSHKNCSGSTSQGKND